MGSTMKRTTLVSVACGLLFAVAPLTAQSPPDNEARIRNAMSAAPSSIADRATILDWPAAPGAEMAVLRAGSSQWTCFPAMPSTPGNDPMCVDGPWLDWMKALANRTEPNTTRMGFGYMLQENDSPYSNTVSGHRTPAFPGAEEKRVEHARGQNGAGHADDDADMASGRRGYCGTGSGA
jgi:hypothetical protein